MKRLFLAVLAAMFLAVPAIAENPMSSVPRVTSQELKAKMDRGDAPVILDLRSKKAYDSSDVKIKSAQRIAPQELDARAKDLPMGREIITYCT